MNIKKVIILSIIMFILPINVHAIDRCQEYLPDIRAYSIQYNGADFPWWYNVGCAMVESSCRGDIDTSFDGGIGLFQLTPNTGIIKEISKYIPVDPYNTKSNIRAQSYYIMRIRTVHFKRETVKIYNKYIAHPSIYVEQCGFNLADVYRFYNGGYYFFYESEIGNFVCDNKEMRKFCIRGGTYTDKAKTKWLNFCDVNYSYPEKIYKYSQKYKIGKDGQHYWYQGECSKCHD